MEPFSHFLCNEWCAIMNASFQTKVCLHNPEISILVVDKKTPLFPWSAVMCWVSLKNYPVEQLKQNVTINLVLFFNSASNALIMNALTDGLLGYAQCVTTY